ncbi:TonB-dependent receptor [Flavobacterium arcticum]|uniref:TonB-dependent receptor n=1 Tax=Flavobacterium arcticum TaxID=1784713 RepID=A0A345HAI8_9FLAO|nr:TonB-dependent receptor [Flavobacterium arcticum]AXG73598.1 TonB-dependent receptor [Flavobacterium arcticum]KAF2506423.1 TonB-dependent receptor [Flavobacterium arcticum]
MKFHQLLLPLLLAVSWSTQAQYTLSGTVQTPKGIPLDGAHIHSNMLHSVSTPDGYYEINAIPKGEQRVVISYIGYTTLDTVIDFRNTIVLNATLQPHAAQLQEVVLTENNTVSQNTVHEQRLKTETIEKYSSATLGDALKEISGVYALKTGTTIVKPIINGLHSSRVPVISNNVRLEDQQWGTEHAPNLDINSAGRISVIKGANALQYGGDAIGGLVLVEPMKVLKDTLFGKTILTGNSNGHGGNIATSLHRGNEKGWAWNANGSFKYMGDREAPDYVISNTGNREANFSGDAKYIGSGYDISGFYSFYNADIGIAKATHIGNTTDLVNAINNQQPSIIEPFTHTISAPRQEIQHHLAKLDYNKKLSDNASLNLQYAFQLNRRKEFDLRRGEYKDVPALDLTLVTHSAQANWKKYLGDVTLKSGASFSLQNNDASPDTGISPLIPNYTKTDVGAYGIASYSFSDSFSGEAGLRYDFTNISANKYYKKSRWSNLGYDGVFDHFITGEQGSQWLTKPKFTYHNVSASLGVRKRLSNNLELLGNAGLAMRNPNPSELFSDGLHHSNGTIELGDLGLKKEQAVKLSATLLKSGDVFTFEATPFINRIHNFIYLQPTAAETTIRGSFPVYNYKQTDALLTGIDLNTHWKPLQNLQHTFGFAYVRGTNTVTDEPIIDMPPLNINNTVRYTIPKWHDLFVELRNETVFTQSRYPNYNFYTDVPQDGELISTLVDVSTPPKGYSLLHFTSGVQFALGKMQTAVNLSVYNIFNTTYRDYLNRQRLYTDEAGRNIQLQIKFTY